MFENRIQDVQPQAIPHSAMAFVVLPVSFGNSQADPGLNLCQLLYQKAYDDARAAVMERKQRDFFEASLN